MSVQRIVIGPSASSAPINTGSKMINTWWSFVWSEVWLIIIYGLPGLPFIVNADSSDHDVLLCWFRNPLPGPCSQSSQCPGQKSTVRVSDLFCDISTRKRRNFIGFLTPGVQLISIRIINCISIQHVYEVYLRETKTDDVFDAVQYWVIISASTPSALINTGNLKMINTIGLQDPWFRSIDGFNTV